MHDFADIVRAGPHGLLSRGDLERIDAHIQDALVAHDVLTELQPTTLVDVGTGGGLPGIPLALAFPLLHVHLVESLGWKCEFLLEAVQRLGIADRVQVHQLRAESAITEIERESCDVGVCRALASPSVALEYLSPLVRVGGSLILWTTAERLERDPVPARAAELLGIGSTPSIHSAPSPLRDAGVLAVWERVASCSTRVPRRVGVASRKPL